MLITSSARLLLHNPERHAFQRTDGTATERRGASDTEPEIAGSLLRVATNLRTTGRCGAEEISPFCIEAMYRSGIFYARRFRSTGEQSDSEALDEIKKGLSVINGRWRASGMP